MRYLYSCLLAALSLVLLAGPLTAQPLHLVMMEDALSAVEDSYSKFVNRQNRGNVPDPERNPAIIAAKDRILAHAFPKVLNAGGNLTPVNSRVTNKNVGVDRRNITSAEVRDAVLGAIKGREAQMAASGYLLARDGTRAPPVWANVNPAANDNRILLSIAADLDQFRRDFDARAGSDELRGNVRGAPNLAGRQYQASTLGLIQKISETFLAQYKSMRAIVRNRDPQGGAPSLVTRWTEPGPNGPQTVLFWNEMSLADLLPEALDHVRDEYTARVTAAEATNPGAAGQQNPRIPDNRRWQAFVAITDSELAFERANWSAGDPLDRDLTSFVAGVNYDAVNTARFGLDDLTRENDDLHAEGR